MLKSTCLVAAAALTLSSCQTTGNVDTGIRNSLPQICAGGETAYAVLLPYIAAGKLKPKVEAAAVSAYESLQRVCADRDNATLASTLISASSAALAISIAVKDAKKMEVSK